MTAHRDGSACTEAVARKPQGKNPREMMCRRCRARYGDLIAVLTVNARRQSVAVR
jgi:hypothetical protein